MRALAGLGLGIAVLAVLHGGSAARISVPTFVAAHRGGALLWPENSLLAFRNAIALGADYLEFDVHLSRDGEVVVIHDPTLDRTTSGGGPVRDRSLAELRALRLRDGTGGVTEESLPTLDEVARLVTPGNRQMLVEIKVDERGRRYPEIEEKVLAILDRRGTTHAAVVMAFERETWRRVRELRPDVRAGALYSPRTLDAMGSTAAHEMEAAQKAGVVFVGLQHSLIGADVVDQARRLRLVLGAWTVNEEGAMVRLIQLGVGLIISDRPDLAIRALAIR